MKRLLLFLLVFGGGLAILLFFVQKERDEKNERADQGSGQIPIERRDEIPPPPVVKDETDAQEGEGDPATGEQGPEVRVQIGGKFKGWVPDEEGRRLYDFDLKDVAPLSEDEYLVNGATLRKLDVEDGSVLTQVVAKQAWVRIDTEGGSYALSSSEPVRLKEAVVKLLTGSPLAPITLELPEAEFDLKTGTLSSSSNVRVLGDGLFGTGNGLLASQGNQRLELQRDGYLRLRTDDEIDIELRAASAGAIVFERLELRRGVEKVEVRLAQGGELTVNGERDVTVEGNSITLNGRVEETPETTAVEGEEPRKRRAFAPEYAKIVGDVLFTRDTETASGESAEVFFDAAGDVNRIKMFDEPTARGLLLLDSKDGTERSPVPIVLTGLGPMELEYSAESPVAKFLLPGPAILSSPEADFRIEALTGMEGSFWGRGLVNLDLRGEVTGRFDGVEFEGSDVELRGSQQTEAIRRVYLETEQPAHFLGRTDKDEPFDVRSAGLLQLELQRDDTRLVLGRDVTLTMGSEEPFTVEVAELRDLDLEARTFEASGGMTYVTPDGSGQADRAVGHSREHIELFGSEERRASFDLDAAKSESLEAGFVRASHIDVRPDRVRADGLVELRFEDPQYSAEIDCNWFELRLLEGRVEGRPTPFEFEAGELERAVVKGEDIDTTFLAESVSGTGTLTELAGGGTELTLDSVSATGDVRMRYDGGGGRFNANGGKLLWDLNGVARLEARAGERVEARGRFREEGLPYVLTATWIEYSSQDIQALFPEITLDRPAALPQPLSGGLAVELHSGGAEWMTADDAGILLAGKARFSGLTEDGKQIELDAGSMHLLREEEGDARGRGMQELVAWDGFVLKLEDDVTGTGEILQLGYEVLRFEGRPARVEAGGFIWESNNIVYDVPRVLITTDQGTLFGAPGTASEGWVATYESLQPFETADSTMMVMRNPVLRAGGRELRGKWATFWLDRDEWLDKTRQWLDGEEVEERSEVPIGPEPADDTTEPLAPTLFGKYDASQASSVLKEVYLEGDIQYTIDGERVAEMEAFYVDLVLGHGWIQEAELFLDTKVGSLRTKLAVRADWLRHSSDGSLSADRAEVTSCNFAEPHYFIRTRNLRLTPTGDGSSVWDVLLRDNSVVFDNGVKVPLPKVHYKSDGKGRPTFGGLRAGSSARFGSFIEASVDVDVSDAVAETMAPLLNSTAEEIDSRYRVRASYFGSRGLLLDQRFNVTAGDHFWMDTFLNGIYDSGEDRGFLRYKEEGSSELRYQLSTLGRYGIRDQEWVDFQIATQSDLGVQSEFEETQFVNYERRDTFVRWRKAEDQNYYSAIARYRLDDFRNDVERLPEAGVLRSLTPVTEVWGQPLLYTASADVGYLRLRQSREGPISPFDPDLDPALGNRDYFRADTRHRIEAPFDVGAGGVRISPYTSVAATAWGEGVEEDDSPTRGAVIAGVEAQTNLFRTWKYGIVNSITPFVGVRGDLASFEDSGEQIQVDPLDDPLIGRFVDLGLRGRWRVPGGARYLDASIRQSHADDVAAGEEDGWRPARVLAELVAVYQGVPFAITHDGQYDFDDGETPLSYTSLSVLPFYDLGLEISYNRGLDANREVLYDAIGVGGRWDASKKWQFEGQQSVSQLDGQALSTNVMLRRIGHDFIFEIVYAFRSGEGGNSVAFKYRPLLGWNPSSFGLMQVLQRAR